MAVEGVTGVGFAEGQKEINVHFDPALTTPSELDEKVRAAGTAAVLTGYPEVTL